MTTFLFAVFGLVLLLGIILVFFQRTRLRSLSLGRLEKVEKAVKKTPLTAPGRLSSLSRHYLLPWVLGAVLGAVFYLVAGLPELFCVVFGGILGIFLTLLDGMRVAKATHKLQVQLAEGIDLMVGALRAGLGAVDSIGRAAREVKPPLRGLLQELLGRLRLGEDPQAVVRVLQERVPLESYRLFGSALSVHWEIGGSLGPTLAGVGRTIRDRVELSRRVRSQGTQAKASVFVILSVSYFLGFMSWRSDPGRMEAFIGSPTGGKLTAGVLLLQAIGILWISKMSKIRF